MTQSVPMRKLVAHAVGGGWGYDIPTETTDQVAIIRGADFPKVAVGDGSTVPVRWEERKKLSSRLLEPNDIVLEVSGGTSDRPTGRTVFVSKRLLDSIGRPTIPASFCRLVRIDSSQADPYYVYWWLQGMYADGRTWGYQNRSTGIANFQFEYFLDAEKVALPPMPVQAEVAATLGALDDKIESNRHTRTLLRQLGFAKLASAISNGESVSQTLAELTNSIARGIAPKYADDDATAPLVLNQRCIRDGWVTAALARHMVERAVAPAKKAASGDILVNSTGTGTLGRVARWHEGEIFVDGHVSVVKPDRTRIAPTVLAYALLGRESDIEGLATGSTGQTELSAERLGSLMIDVPVGTATTELEYELLSLERKAHQVGDEITVLASLRDALLPELLSGRIHVSEVQEAVA